MTRTLVCAAVLSLCGTLAVPAQTISGGTGQATAPTGGRGGQRPGSPPPRDSAAEPSTGTARIRGRVTAADTGSPVRRASISLFLVTQGRARTTTTDADGRFEFTNLPAGSYNLAANKAGFMTQSYGQRRLNSPGVPVAVRDGQALSQVDFALMRGGVITGRITDDFGDPLAGAQVQVQRYTYGPNGRQLSSTATGPGNFVTDDLGQFRIYGLAPGDYVVSGRVQASLVQAPNQDDRGEGYPPTYYPGTPNVAEAQMVTVTASQEASVHFAMMAARLARVAGRVVDSQGRPAAGAMLQLSSGTPGSGMTMGAGQVAPDGTFSINRVPPGDHVIRVTPRIVNLGRDALVSAMPGTAPGEAETGTLPVSVASDDVTGLLIQLRPAARITGRIVFEGTTERPNVQQVRVMVQSADAPGGVVGSMISVAGPAGRVVRQPGQPSADGTFELPATGRGLIRVTGQLGGWQLKSVTQRGTDITDTAIDLNDDVDGVRVVLTDTVTEVSGTVAGVDAGAPEGFAVLVLPREEIEGPAAQRYMRTTRLARPDRFSMRGLPAGDYVAMAFEWLDQGQEWDPRVRAAVRESGERFSLAEGQARTLSLRVTPQP